MSFLMKESRNYSDAYIQKCSQRSGKEEPVMSLNTGKREGLGNKDVVSLCLIYCYKPGSILLLPLACDLNILVEIPWGDWVALAAI